RAHRARLHLGATMEYRQLGQSGLRVSVLTLGTMTFGGTGWASAIGSTHLDGAKRQIGLCLDTGVNLIDTADVYSEGLSEEILGEAISGMRDDVLLASKVRMPMGEGPNDAGLSRYHVIRGCEATLRRLRTDYLDLYQVHEWDGQTPLEETLDALDSLVRAGKVRYVGASNYTAWQLMKALGISDRHGFARFVSQQIYYSLQARDAEYELVPLTLDQGLGIFVWSPLAGGLLSGKYRRGQDAPAGSRHPETGASHPSTTRPSSTTRSSCSWRLVQDTACPRPRSRWPTSCASPESPRSSSAREPRTSWLTIWRQRTCSSPTTSWRALTR